MFGSRGPLAHSALAASSFSHEVNMRVLAFQTVMSAANCFEFSKWGYSRHSSSAVWISNFNSSTFWTASEKDEGSSNGTYINGKRIESGQFFPISRTDKVTLSKDYNFDFTNYIVVPSSDETLILNPKANDQTVIFEANRVTVHSSDKTVMFDPQKTGISDLSKFDNSPYGRINDEDMVP